MHSRLKKPRHIAIVMDGNGRWAKKQNRPRVFGHQQGVEAARSMVESAARWDIEALTLFAFSSENWNRPQQEVGFLMNLFIKALNAESKKLAKNNVRMKIIGEVSRFDKKLQQTIEKVEALTADNDGLKLYIAANYGGRWDIVQAVRSLCLTLKHKTPQAGIDVDAIDEQALESKLMLADAPAVDLFIRTGGEQRISNFLLWQLAYAELFFSDKLWPDYGPADLQQAIEEFSHRERRFGKLATQHSNSQNTSDDVKG